MKSVMEKGWFFWVYEYARRCSPASVALIASLLLSFIAVIIDPVLNRDGILYIHAAEMVMREGIDIAGQDFNWPFFPLLIAGISWLTSLDAELVSYLICAFFLAGACFFLVRISDRLIPGSGWVAALVVLCLPALNDYRPYIIREFGAWFFAFGALYALVCWREARGWKSGVFFQAGVGMAVLFRPEMLFVFPGVFLAWPWLRRPGRDLRDLAALFWMCGLAGIFVVGFLIQDLSLIGGRLEKFLGYLDISEQISNFHDVAQHFGTEILHKISRGSAGFILFWGLVALIPAKALGLLGVFALPLGYAFRPGLVSKGRLKEIHPFPALVLVYLGILVLFLVVKQFVSGRYVILLVLLLLPLVVEGVRAFWALSWGKGWRYLFVTLLVLTLADGVITTGDRKLYIISAGEWIRQHTLPEPVYFDERKQRYYAGFEYQDKDESPSREEVLGNEGGQYNTVVLLVKNRSQAERIQRWVDQSRFRQVASFGEKYKGVRILVSDQP